MAQAVVYHRPDIVGCHLVPAAQPGVRARGFVQRYGAARADTNLDVARQVLAEFGRPAGRGNQRDDIVLHRFGDLYRGDLGPCRKDRALRDGLVGFRCFFIVGGFHATVFFPAYQSHHFALR